MKGNKRALGLEGERVAAEFLKKQGYKILQRNYKAGLREIDIIGYDKGVISFLEVKASISPRYGPPELRVTEAKRSQLQKAATRYIREKNLWGQGFRFDVVSVSFTEGGEVLEIKLIKDAFSLKA